MRPRWNSSLFWAAILAVGFPPIVFAQPTNDAFWDPNFGLPGPVQFDTSVQPRVSIIELVGEEAYIGGRFDGIGNVYAPRVAHWDGTQWSALGSGVSDGNVSAILVEGSDVYVGGSFWSAGGVPAVGVARWDGSAWSALGDGIEPGGYAFDISSLVRNNGQLWAAGWRQIDHAGGTEPVFAVWDGVDWTSYMSDDYYGSVNAMKSDGQFLYLAGSVQTLFVFPPVEGGVLRWDGTALTPMGDGLQGNVYDLEFFDGQLHAVGDFSTSGLTTVRNIAAWNGTSWYEVGGGITAPANAELYSASVHDGLLYVGGDFETAGAVNSKDLAWWDGAQWHPYTGPPIGASAFGNRVSEVAVGDDGIHVSGDFTRVGGTTSYGFARWDGVAWHSHTDEGQLGINDEVRALVGDGAGGIYAGGEFAYAGDSPTGCIAHFDGAEWTALGSGLGGALLAVWALEHDGADLFAGGRFTTAGGVAVQNLARWDGGAWSDVGGGLSGGLFPAVFAIHSDGSDLYVGGQFTMAGAVPASNVTMWDGSIWHALGSGTNGTVLEFIAWNGVAYVGGNFTTAGGAPALYVASWDGSNWAQVGAGFNAGVNSFAVFGGELYAGGSFNNSGGEPMVGIAKFNGSSWEAVGGGLGSGINDLEAVASGVYACGPFQTAGGNTTKRIAKWTGTEWQPLGSGFPGVGISAPQLYALAAVDDHLYVGGHFVQVGGKAISCVARWNWTGPTTDVRPHTALRVGLGNCVPNPFNPSTAIPYSVGEAGRVTLAVYDVAGRHVRTLVDRDHAPRTEEFVATWDGRDDAGRAVTSGVYFCRMTSGSFKDTRKMVLLK